MNTFTRILTLALFAMAARSYAESFTLKTIAGQPGLRSVDGTDRAALFSSPRAVAYGPGGDLYVADGWAYKVSRIRLVGTNWITTTLAGGSPGAADGTNTAAQFLSLSGIAVDASTNIYVSDMNAIRKITPQGSNWVVSTWAGQVVMSGSQDGTSGRLNFPMGLAVDPDGNVYVADSGNHAIRKLVPSGKYASISTIAGTAGSVTPSPGSTDATGTSARFRSPGGLVLDASLNLYVADTGNSTIRKLTRSGSSWNVGTVAGSALQSGTADGTNTVARFSSPLGVCMGPDQAIFVADSGNHALRKVSLDGANAIVATVAGMPGAPGAIDGTNWSAQFNNPTAVASDGVGRVFVADAENCSLRQVLLLGTNAEVTTIAGESTARRADGLGALARFWQPNAITVGTPGELFVADMNNHAIRRVTSSPSGWLVTMIAGEPGIKGSSDGTNSGIRFSAPSGVAFAPDGSLYVADRDNHTIRQLTRAGADWISATIAGLPGLPGTVDGTNSAARFWYPTYMTVNSAGQLFVAESVKIRLLTRFGADWAVSSLPGTYPNISGLACDSEGNLLIADAYANSIRKATRMGDAWTVTTVAGPTGLLDGTNSTSRFKQPSGLAVDSNGVIYMLDRLNNCLRRIAPDGTNLVVSTLAGSPPLSGSSDGNGAAARLNWPYGLAIDTTGALYIADTYNDTIRMAWPTPALQIQHSALAPFLAGSGVEPSPRQTNSQTSRAREGQSELVS